MKELEESGEVVGGVGERHREGLRAGYRLNTGLDFVYCVDGRGVDMGWTGELPINRFFLLFFHPNNPPTPATSKKKKKRAWHGHGLLSKPNVITNYTNRAKSSSVRDSNPGRLKIVFFAKNVYLCVLMIHQISSANHMT